MQIVHVASFLICFGAGMNICSLLSKQLSIFSYMMQVPPPPPTQIFFGDFKAWNGFKILSV